MKISKQRLKQIISEEIEKLDRDGDQDDQAELADITEELKELIDDFDVDPPNESGGFFLTLVRETGNFLGPREQQIAQEMRDACLKILLAAKSNTYKSAFPSSGAMRQQKPRLEPWME